MSLAPARRSAAGFLRLALLAACLLAVGIACGGGGGGSTEPPPPPPPPPPGFTFTPSGSATTNGLVLARGAGTSSDVLVLELRAESIENLYGVSFDLAYPEALLRYEGAEEGPFLGSDGAATSLQDREVDGTVVFGATRLGDVGGVGGTGVVARFRFVAEAAGDGSFAFSDNEAFGPDGEVLPGIVWIGGSLRVVR